MKKTIVAAGGLVMNDNKELLMIFRRGKWDLPKGKLDEGETIEQCAVREVKEETGLKDVELKTFTGKTYHEYDDEHINNNVIKETHWYEMLATGNQKLIPQTSEGIDSVEWVSHEKIKDKLNNSYKNIAEIISKL